MKPLRRLRSSNVSEFALALCGAVLSACSSGSAATSGPPAPSIARPSPGSAVRAAAPAPAAPVPLDSLEFADLVAALRARAESGADRELAGHADLLGAIERLGLQAAQKPIVRRADWVEQGIASKYPGGTAFATVATYLEPGADPDRVQRAYMTYERYPEWTGKPDVQLVAREGADAIASANGVRSGPFGLKFGARWRFRAHPVVRGRARINVVSMVPSSDTEHMREMRTLLVAFPEDGGSRVVEASASDVDIDAPPLFGGVAMQIAMKDVRERAANLRSRWSELSR